MDNPLVTFALIAYNQENYIREAVEAALAQTYSPLEIILSDDGSKDRTFEIMQELAAAYHGPHQVTVRRNEPNLGLAGHINAVWQIVKGEFVIGAAGDDISLPWRTEVLVRHFQQNPQCVLLGSFTQCFGTYHNTVAALLVDDECRHNLVTRCKTVNDGVQGASFAYRKTLIDAFPPLEKTTQMEDVVFAFRAWEIGTFELVPEVLLLYRTHAQSLCSAQSKEDTIAYQVKLHNSVFDQMCIDLKRFKRTLDEIAPALITLRKREIGYLKILLYHRNPSLLNLPYRTRAISRLILMFHKGSFWKRIRRNRERKNLHALVLAKWNETLALTEGPRSIPPNMRRILDENHIHANSQ